MTNNQYPLDCAYGETNTARSVLSLKPYYCNKLARPILPRDCFGCGWFYRKLDAGSIGEAGKRDLEAKLKEKA